MRRGLTPVVYWKRQTEGGAWGARLMPDKGLLVLLNAVRQLSARAERITLDVLGDEPLKQDTEELSRHLANGPTRIGILGTVAYGAPCWRYCAPTML